MTTPMLCARFLGNTAFTRSSARGEGNRSNLAPLPLRTEPQRLPRFEASNMETRDETVSLISAGKVQGTNVYNTDGDSLGEVYDVMIDKLLLLWWGRACTLRQAGADTAPICTTG
jgi:hypothetical protein